MVDLIVSAIARLVAEFFQSIVQLIMPLLDFSFDSFVAAFPFAATSYSIFQQIALAIVVLVVIVRIVFFFLPNSQQKSSPFRLALMMVIAIVGIYYGNYLLTAIMDIAQMPYYAMLNADATSWTDWNFMSVSNIINDVAFQLSIPLYIVMLLLIGIAFVKLMLEAVGRYAILFVLVYLSPLASATLASDWTFGIFKRYLSMFISQCILMILNVWSIKMVISMFSGMAANPNPVLALLLGYAFLRIAAKLDSYLNSLGLNAAITGAGLGGELMAVGMMAMSRFSPFSGQKSFAGASAADGGSGGILGLGKNLSSGFAKINPAAGAVKGAENGLGALGKTAKQGFNAGKEAAAGTSGSFMDKFKAGVSASKQTMTSNVGDNLKEASLMTQDESLWARGLFDSGNGVDASVNAMQNQESLSSEELNNIATTGFASDRAFESISDNCSVEDPSAVAAIQQGTGLGVANQDAKEAFDVGYGTVEANNVAYKQDSEGASMSYEKDGKIHSWKVKNSSQYSALSPQEQQLYTPYKNKNGTPYYYWHGVKQTPTAAQKAQAVENDIFTKASTFGLSGNLSSSEYGYVHSLSKGKQNEFINSMFSNVKTNNSRIEMTDANQEEFAEFISTGSWKGFSQADQGEFASAFKSGNMSEASFSARGFHAATDNGSTVTILTSNAISTDGRSQDPSGMPLYSKDYLYNKGYICNNLNGQEYWVRKTAPAEKDNFPERV